MLGNLDFSGTCNRIFPKRIRKPLQQEENNVQNPCGIRVCWPVGQVMVIKNVWIYLSFIKWIFSRFSPYTRFYSRWGHILAYGDQINMSKSMIFLLERLKAQFILHTPSELEKATSDLEKATFGIQNGCAATLFPVNPLHLVATIIFSFLGIL